MPNVDLCARLAELAMSAKKDEIKNFAKQISAIPNENEKVIIFRSKTEQEIEIILKRFWDKIRIIIANKYFNGMEFQNLELFKSSNDNKTDADLFCILPSNEQLNIELKFGLKTDRNIGMRLFSRIFDTDIFEQSLDLKFRKDWEEKFAKDQDENEQFLRLWGNINNAIDYFNALYKSRNFRLSDECARHMEQSILLSTGNGNSNNKLIKFIVENNDFNVLDYGQIGLGEWVVDEVEKINTIKGAKPDRCNISVKNYTTNIQIKYTLNWKNNYFIEELNRKVKSILGFGSPNWNVWVKIEITQIEA